MTRGLPHAIRWMMACVAALLAACSPIRILNGAVPDDASTVLAGLSYGSDPRQVLDIYVPPGVQRPPVVVFVYGGSWSSGDRESYRFVGDALNSRGILAVVIDYRLYPQVTYPDFVADTAQAVAWTLDHIGAYGGDAGRVFLAGHSAGGYNAAMVALDPRWLARFGHSPQQLKGWIGMAGPYEFLPIVSRTLRPIFHFPDTPPDSQPVVHAGADAPPTLLMAGTDDTLVDPVRNTRALADALRRAGARVEQVEYPGLGHQMLAGALARPLRWRAPVLDDLSRFVLAAVPPRLQGDPP